MSTDTTNTIKDVNIPNVMHSTEVQTIKVSFNNPNAKHPDVHYTRTGHPDIFQYFTNHSTFFNARLRAGMMQGTAHGTLIVKVESPFIFDGAMEVLELLSGFGNHLPNVVTTTVGTGGHTNHQGGIPWNHFNMDRNELTMDTVRLFNCLVDERVLFFLDEYLFESANNQCDSLLLDFLMQNMMMNPGVANFDTAEPEWVTKIIALSHRTNPRNLLTRTLKYGANQLNKQINRVQPSPGFLLWIYEEQVRELQPLFVDGTLQRPDEVTEDMVSETAFPKLFVLLASRKFDQNTVNVIEIAETNTEVDQRYFQVDVPWYDGNYRFSDSRCELTFRAKKTMEIGGTDYFLFIGRLYLSKFDGDWVLWITPANEQQFRCSIRPLWWCIRSRNHPFPRSGNWVPAFFDGNPPQVRAAYPPIIKSIQFIARHY